MRWIPLLATLTACVHATTPKAPIDPTPPAVEAADRSVVAIYVNATCDTLENAAGRVNGFYVRKNVVATVDHLRRAAKGLFPDLAVIGPEGCKEGQYADRFENFDVMFLLVHRSGAPILPISERPPAAGDTVWTSSSEEMRKPDGPMAEQLRHGVKFRHLRLIVEPLPATTRVLEQPPLWSAKPDLRLGDSGSPAFDARGNVLGMLTAAMGPKNTGIIDESLFLSAFVIEALIHECAPCIDD